MSPLVAILGVVAFVLTNGFLKVLGRRSAKVLPSDFNFGPQTSLAALLLVLDSALIAGRLSNTQSMGLGAVAVLSLLVSTFLTKVQDNDSGTVPVVGVKFWSAWAASNLLGLICVGLVGWYKYMP